MSKLEAVAQELGHEEHVALVPGDIAVRETTEAIVHLATASFTTGVILPVDGGYVHLDRALNT